MMPACMSKLSLDLSPQVLSPRPELHACAVSSSTRARTTNVLLACAALQQLVLQKLAVTTLGHQPGS
eukprot:816656-Pelagomonas_calceolata.AAC.1